ncbi:MAG: glycosyltransferase family 4 protein [Fimbriimonadales bacterium]|nr:glycosyltransferase family 4 protein [Fimbriimonadales bacterium]MDW8052003.1 glycosyltransferase family 4 protein [Armatimonadota bacterium]
MSSLLLERPHTLPKERVEYEGERKRTPVLIVVRPSSSGMLRHVQGLLKYLPEFGYLPTLTGPEFIHDRAGLIADTRAVRQLRARAKGFPLVHCHGVRAGWICAWAFKRDYPWVWTVHHLLRSNSALVRALWRWIAKYPRAITAVSEAVQEGLERGGIPPERVVVVRGGIDLERFEKLPRKEVMREQFFVPATRPVLLCVGRFVYHKGFDIAIQAMERIWAVFPDADLWLAGDGPENVRLVKLVTRCSRPHRVRFFGYWSAVEELYAAADVLLAPARDAGLGLAVMEAMACGLPVVATDIPPMHRLVEHERTGLLVPPENPEALAAAALRLLQDSALAQRLSRNALQVAEQFHIRHTAAQTARIYQRVLG